MGYSEKEDGCSNSGSTTALSMLGFSSGERTARSARMKVLPPNSKRTKSLKLNSALTSGLKASCSGVNSEPETPPPEK